MAVGKEPTFVEWRVSGFLARRRKPDVLRAIDRGMLRAGRDLVPVVQAFTPVHRGFMNQGWGVFFVRAPRGIRIANSNNPKKVGSMETGRRASMPPVAPLIRWVTAKFGLRGKKAVSAAWAVATKMKTRGIVVPLKVSRLGGMLRRALKTVGAGFFGRAVKVELDILK